ncbi:MULTISPECIES: tRNA pseudouridine(38-40) synthase TruA [unclassified Paenibacillus]|uniref:tRNA pseudouridine(38-40) synthase TruA n=1 Tax=unclassified Paenibacillus TaxID=185978 RepID=UPI001AE82A9C|nr:tRNA pseudouridine38-40 synthase [Paenibacillus sp. PvP091]MBP1171030.1 tRNA pseudouridine38-40 synthase [Paenibacillus sp. PvR098]MBP2442058.1 tRNA pseudouridine38-40 synthase [Paenibacillus sp. PvP052]
MRNICITISYDGTAYNGFQTQPEKKTVQDHLEHAILKLTGEEIKLTSSGRTDAGVHARGQVVNFYTSSCIPIERWCLAINSWLPRDIIVWDAMQVADGFHARRSAKQKTYRYTIRCGRYIDTFKRHFEVHHPTSLNVEAMRAGLNQLIGEHDFTSFCSTRSVAPSHIRNIYDAWIECEPVDEDLQSFAMHIYITGNGFLYNMVRIITGTLIQIGEGKRQSSEMRSILEAKDRSMAGPTAMPHGLMLWKVFYGEKPKHY